MFPEEAYKTFSGFNLVYIIQLTITILTVVYYKYSYNFKA